MEIYCKKHIKDAIELEHLNLDGIIEYVKKKTGEKIKNNPSISHSDISFIKQNYRDIMMDLWEAEIKSKIETKKQKELKDSEILKLLEIFQKLKGFDETPVFYRGPIFKQIRDERKNFMLSDFVNPRTEICKELVYMIKNTNQGTSDEFTLFEYLTDVLKNSFDVYPDLVLKLELKEFAKEELSLFKLSQNILANNFEIEKYEDLKKTAKIINDEKKVIHHIFQKEIGIFLNGISCEKIQNNEIKLCLIQGKVATSKDIESNFVADCDEIHIICDMIHIDRNLPVSYQGKNVFVMSETTWLHKKSIWNLSGRNERNLNSQTAGVQSNGDGRNGINGEAGDSGGNCEIITKKIINPKMWTIKSNGGNGSNGQDGGDGIDGTNGNDIVEDDFMLCGERITNSNFLSLLEKYGISTSIGLRSFNIFENNLEKHIIFSRNDIKSELLMLIKGSPGNVGTIGGCAGLGGQGGYEGKIKIHCENTGCEIINNIGRDGSDGKCGYIGQFGRNGRDACMKVSTFEQAPSYKFANSNSIFRLELTDEASIYSIFCKSLKKFYALIEENEEVSLNTSSQQNNMNDYEQRIIKFARDDERFFETFTSVIKNSNKNLQQVIEKLKIQDFINGDINLGVVAVLITKFDIDIFNYNVLKSYAKLFTERSSKLEQQLREFLREFISKPNVIKASNNVYELRGTIILSEDINSIEEDFNQLNIICEILHINSNLSDEKFHGRSMFIYVKSVIIHKSVTFNLSGFNNFLKEKYEKPNENLYEHGGHCIIKVKKIKNPNLLTIISNGGHASLAQNGIDVQEKDFLIEGMPIEYYPTPIKQTYNDDGLEKILVKKSNSNYLLLVKGSFGVPGFRGLSDDGGLPGYVEVKYVNGAVINEIDILCEPGRKDFSRDGRDAFIIAIDGDIMCFGLNELNKYDIISSTIAREHSLEYSEKFYFAKFSKSLKDQNGLDTVGFSLYDNLVWVLRNSVIDFDKIVNQFEIKNFAEYKKSLKDVARKIKLDGQDVANRFQVANCSNLINAAKCLKDVYNEVLMRDATKLFFNPAKISSDSNILTIQKEICCSSDVYSWEIRAEITEIHLICDTLHIISELPENFRGKNFAIISNYVQVHKKVKWDFSGEVIYCGFDDNAGQDKDGTGKNGQDGLPGNSGGNFLLKCKIIENSSALTIVSNGGDGTDGQDGGNGEDGKNGEDASINSLMITADDFKKDGLNEFDIIKLLFPPVSLAVFFKGLDFSVSLGLKEKEHEFSDGKRIHMFYRNNLLFVKEVLAIVKGTNGTTGKLGGIFGRAGRGGFAGKVKIFSEYTPHNVKIFAMNGSDGKSGKSGYNGISGCDGKDIWKYGSINYNGDVYGNNERNKYKFIWTSDGEPDEKSLYDNKKRMYVKVVCEEIPDISPVRERNETEEKNERHFKIPARKCDEINEHIITEKSSSILNNKRLNIERKFSSDASLHESRIKSFKLSVSTFVNQNSNYFKSYSFKINVKNELATSKKLERKVSKMKSDISKDKYSQQYSDFFKSTKIDVTMLSETYNNIEVNMEEAEMQIQTDIYVPQEFYSGIVPVMENCEERKYLYSVILSMIFNGCKASDLFQKIRETRFSDEEYKCLIDNICGHPFIESSNRPSNDNKSILNESIAKISNDLKIGDFMKYVAKNYPFILEDFFKNSIENSQYNTEDIRKICMEKLMLLFFQTIYQDIVNKNNAILSNLIPSNDSLTDDTTYFQKETDEFTSNLISLERFLKSCSDCEKREIIEFLEVNIQDVNSKLPESIYQLINQYEAWLPEDIKEEWKDVLTRASDVLNEIQQLDSNDSEIDDKTDKLYNSYLNIISAFLNKSSVIASIKNNIKSFGSKSILYKRILAHKFNIRLSIYTKNFSNGYDIAEMHNFDEQLENKYAIQGTSSNDNILTEEPKELFLLQKNEDFSILENDNERIESHRYNQKLRVAFEMIIETISEGNIANIKNSSGIQKDVNSLYKKFCIVDEEKLIQLLNDEDFLINDDKLIDIIVSSFRYTIIKNENNDKISFQVDEENKKKFQNLTSDKSNINYYVCDDQHVRDDIKQGLNMILNKFGLSVIKAIAIRLFVDQNIQFIDDFSVVLKCILNRSEEQKYHILFMILGNDQNLLSFELALQELEIVYGVFDIEMKRIWREKATQTKYKQIFSLFLEKVLQHEDEMLIKHSLDQVIDNMQFFDADNYEDLKKLKLASWRLVTTDRYWRYYLQKLQLNDFDQQVDNMVESFEILSTKYGTKAKDLLKILLKKRDDINAINIVTFLDDFGSDKFTLSNDVLEELSKIPVTKWMHELQKIYSAGGVVRRAQKIVKLIKNDHETSNKIKLKIDEIGEDAENVFEVTSSLNGKKIVELSHEEIKEWITTTKSSDTNPSIIECLAVIVRMFEFEIGFKLRDTQIMTILIMWNNDKGVLTQVSTGEGKTFIGVAFAILKVLNGEKIDIITSSSVLAERDAVENKKFFEFFGITVDHNCHNSVEERKQAYKCQVVYGVLGNFQRDYLLTEFYNENFMSGHHFNNVLVDEVDSMLLDKGNNILYLSSNVPDIDELGYVFMLIWQYVNQIICQPAIAEYNLQTAIARKNILNAIYGYIDESIIQNLQLQVDSKSIIQRLEKSKIIEENGIFFDEHYIESKFTSALNGIDKEISEKIKFYCKETIETEKLIKIPKYLKNFVCLHLESWIESAKSAIMLQNKNEYIIDRVNSGRNISEDPKIIIVDLDTGTDMSNSKWDKGLHQFLELKHGCRLSPISLKSVFISNVSYFKKYTKLYGMTGTLGSMEERNKTTAIHKIDFATIPRYIERKYQEYPPILETDSSLWIQKIEEEVLYRFEKNQSVLIICETIDDTDIINNFLLKSNLKFSVSNVKVYQRDIEQFNIEKLPPKMVIVATNLASRGTDIKLSDELKDSGGLHVILSYLPQNARIENQAFGRAARAGDVGSGRLIIHVNPKVRKDITKLKETRYLNELRRLDEVNSFYQNFITIEEGYFEKFHSAFRELKHAGNNINSNSFKIITNDFIKNYNGFMEAKNTNAIKIFLENFKLSWSFWLDENSKELEKSSIKKADLDASRECLQQKFNQFLSNPPKLHPVKRIELFKYYNHNEFQKAKATLFDEFQSDSVAYQYYKCYEIIKRSQKNKGFKRRYLSSEERSELIKCLKMLKQRINARDAWTEVIDGIKKQRTLHDNLIEIKALKNQQKELNEVDEAMIENIQIFLGIDVTPNALTMDGIQHDYLTEDLYQKLIQNDDVEKPKILSYNDDELRSLARKYKIKSESLKKILKHNKKIKSLKDFEEHCVKSIKMPTREEFWMTLKSKEILTDEIEYAIIDLNLLKEIDPSMFNEIENNFSNEELSYDSNSEIYFVPLESLNNTDKQFITFLDAFKSQISSHRFNFLLSNNVIQINKRANFNIQKYKELRNEKIFEHFNEIKAKNFKHICANHKRIFEKLTLDSENNKKILKEWGDSYGLIYDNLYQIEENKIFGEDNIYEQSFLYVIERKFQNGMALEMLAKNIENNIKNGKSSINVGIHLHIKPHTSLICELFDKYIIEHAKIDLDKLKNLKSSFSLVDLGSSPEESHITCNATKEFLYDNYKRAIENFDNLKKKLKQLVEAFANDDIKTADVILIPLHEHMKKTEYSEAIETMKLKGFDMVMIVKAKTYSSNYWWHFTIAIVIATVQIIVGILLVIYTQGIGFKIGISLIYDGIRDMIFAFQTLKTRRFSWKDYFEFKKKNITSNITYILTFKLIPTQMFIGDLIYKYIDNSNKYIEIILKAGEIITAVCSRIAKDPYIMNFISDVKKGILDFLVNILNGDFESHELSKTIESMLQYCTPSELQNIILEIIDAYDQEWTRTADNIASMVNKEIQKYVKCDITALTNAVIFKGKNICSAFKLSYNLYNIINEKLNGILITKQGTQENQNIPYEDVQRFKEEILIAIREKCKEKFCNIFESGVSTESANESARNMASEGVNTFYNNSEQQQQNSAEIQISREEPTRLTSYSPRFQSS